MPPRSSGAGCCTPDPDKQDPSAARRQVFPPFLYDRRTLEEDSEETAVRGGPPRLAWSVPVAALLHGVRVAAGRARAAQQLRGQCALCTLSLRSNVAVDVRRAQRDHLRGQRCVPPCGALTGLSALPTLARRQGDGAAALLNPRAKKPAHALTPAVQWWARSSWRSPQARPTLRRPWVPRSARRCVVALARRRLCWLTFWSGREHHGLLQGVQRQDRGQSGADHPRGYHRL